MTSGRVLIDAANLRAGGGVQVAASFIDELGELASDSAGRCQWIHQSLRIEVSPEVLDNVADTTSKVLSLVEVRRRWWDPRIWYPHRQKYDVSFTVFGPAYGARRAARQVVGFADVTSLYWDNSIQERLGARIRRAVRRRTSKAVFKRADRIVVEAGHVRNALESWGISPDDIEVVPNCVNRRVIDSPLDMSLTSFLQHSTEPLFGYVTRAYPHKNLFLLGKVAKVLEEDYGLHVRFLLTLNEAEWADLDTATRAASVNVGEIKVEKLKSFYAVCDGGVFPSLLECFSATPLEFMVTRTPFVGSDRAFVREVAADAAWYADPHEPSEWAHAIASIVAGGQEVERRVSLGFERAVEWPSPRDRARRYIEIIDREVSEVVSLSISQGSVEPPANQREL